MKIASIQAVSVLEEDKQAILANGRGFIALAQKLNAHLSQINVPESAPPEVPRILIRRPDLVVSVGYSRIEITVRPPEHVAENFDNAIEYAERAICPIVEDLTSPERDYKWSGVIVELEFPQPGGGVPALTHIVPFFDRLVRIDRRGRKLASFKLQFGFEDQGLFANVSLEGYETRGFDLEEVPKAGDRIKIKYDDAPIKESGIGVILDINNKPAENRGTPVSDISLLLTQHKRGVTAFLADLSIEEASK